MKSQPWDFDFDLEGEEAVVLKVGKLAKVPVEDSNVWLVGRVLINHYVGIQTFKDVMLNLWTSRGCTEIRNAGRNLFTFKFAT